MINNLLLLRTSCEISVTTAKRTACFGYAFILFVITKYLGLNEQDIEEINNQFVGKVRNAFINYSEFSHRNLAKRLASVKQEKRRNEKIYSIAERILSHNNMQH